MVTQKTPSITVEEVAPETALVTTGSTEISLTSALHVNNHFASAVKYGAEEITATRRLSWFTGNNKRFAANGKSPLENARGWYIDRPNEEEMFPDDYELSDAMEQLCAANLAVECVVDHQGDKVASWYVPVASLFVVCEGVPSRKEMRDVETRWGIAYGWDKQRNRTVMHFQCFIKELMDAGYHGLFTVKFSNKIADCAIECLKAQEYVLKRADMLRQRADTASEALPFYAFALPTTVSAKTITVGKDDKSTEVYYPVPVVPYLPPKDPETIIRYLASVAITTAQAEILEYNGRVEITAEWSVEKSKQLIAGTDTEETDAAAASGNYVGVDVDGNPIPF
jgi:hypothetical protein